MATAATATAALAAPPKSDDENAPPRLHDSFAVSDVPSSPAPAQIPLTYSRIEPLPSSIPPPDNELSIFKLAKEILSSVKPGSDVTNINLPASILDPMSTLEKTKKSMQRGELLQDICASQDPHSRLLNVLRFNFSGLAKERFGKKPYNPVLGEVYRCCFAHRGAAGETLLVAEQVSHHPPISALHLRNDTLGFRMNSYTAPEPKFWGNSLEVRLAGEIRIMLSNFDDEEYVITRPYIHMTGFLAGRQRLEFNGMSTLVCEKNGLGAEIEYNARGSLALRAEMNSVSGRIYELATNETLYTMEGHWDRKVMLTDMKTKQQKTLFDYEAVLTDKSMVAILPPEEEEEQSFSTKVWAECSKAINGGDSAAASAEKRKVEDRQRQLKKERVAAGVEWKCHYFTKRQDGLKGYELRADLTQESFARLSLHPSQIEALRSGEMVKEMQNGLEGTEEGEDRRRNGGRRRLLGRNRGKA